MQAAGHTLREWARNAYAENAWSDAADLFLLADATSPLEPDDIEALAWAAGISGRDADMLAALERLHAHFSALDDNVEAARAAFWIGLRSMMIGEVGRAAGWLQRAAAHAAKTPPDCPQRGYLLLPKIQMHRSRGSFEAALTAAERAITMGQQADDPDLIALAGCLKGGTLFHLGRIAEGLVPIDEAMLACERWTALTVDLRRRVLRRDLSLLSCPGNGARARVDGRAHRLVQAQPAGPLLQR
jgi:tetratricopeptide (TPR) repeat protein